MADELERNYSNIFAMLTRMRQMCLHPSLIASGRDILKELIGGESEMDTAGVRLETYDPLVLQRLQAMVIDGQIDDCPICLDTYDSSAYSCRI